MQPGHYLLILAIILIIAAPTRIAAAVFLAAATFIPMGISFNLASLNFYPVRLLVLGGIIRVCVRSERPKPFPIQPDWFLLLFGIFALVSSAFHKEPGNAFIFRGGLAFDTLGTYFLIRTWISSWEDVGYLIKFWILLTIPLAVFMVVETITAKNLLSLIGGIPADSAIRGGQIRARGPFRHSILAGTMGGICLSLAAGFLRQRKPLFYLVSATSILVVVASRSSGPLMTLAAAGFGLWFWRYRSHLRLVMWITVFALFVLHFFIMKAPVWFLIAHISIGGGGGFYRAKLIDSAITHISEWWLAGTDYTRHWMPSGIAWSADATDITNNYLRLGVIGGLPLMLAFMAILRLSFKYLGKALQHVHNNVRLEFTIWSLGAALFAHVISMISVNYYDQSSALLFVLLAVIISGSITFRPPYQRSNDPTGTTRAEFDSENKRCVTGLELFNLL